MTSKSELSLWSPPCKQYTYPFVPSISYNKRGVHTGWKPYMPPPGGISCIFATLRVFSILVQEIQKMQKQQQNHSESFLLDFLQKEHRLKERRRREMPRSRKLGYGLGIVWNKIQIWHSTVVVWSFCCLRIKKHSLPTSDVKLYTHKKVEL